jgi:prepilin-type N-terminal cleavage/methylation domain-containing protein
VLSKAAFVALGAEQGGFTLVELLVVLLLFTLVVSMAFVTIANATTTSVQGARSVAATNAVAVDANRIAELVRDAVAVGQDAPPGCVTDPDALGDSDSDASSYPDSEPDVDNQSSEDPDADGDTDLEATLDSSSEPNEPDTDNSFSGFAPVPGSPFALANKNYLELCTTVSSSTLPSPLVVGIGGSCSTTGPCTIQMQAFTEQDPLVPSYGWSEQICYACDTQAGSPPLPQPPPLFEYFALATSESSTNWSSCTNGLGGSPQPVDDGAMLYLPPPSSGALPFACLPFIAMVRITLSVLQCSNQASPACSSAPVSSIQEDVLLPGVVGSP